MAVLHAASRNALPTASFAGPARTFPIPDVNHARNALARAHFAPDPAAIRAKVHHRFPQIGAPQRHQLHDQAVHTAIISQLGK